MRSIKILMLTSFLIGAMPMFGAAYMKLGDIKGNVTPASKEKHRDTIQIESWSLGASNPSSGNQAHAGPFRFTVRGAEAESLKALCQSRVPLGNVVVDIDGVKHRLENASFASCPSGDRAMPVEEFAVHYTTCTYHNSPLRGAPYFFGGGTVLGNSAPNARPRVPVFLCPSHASVNENARLTGLSTGPIPIHLERLKVDPNGTSASMSLAKVGTGTLTLSGSNTPLPQVVIERTDGSKWTFTDVRISNVARSGAMTELSLNFTKVEFDS